jgi:Glycosyltransferase
MRYIFFTLRDFDKVGGGSIRIYGVLNALTEIGEEVILISNAEKLEQFHPSVHHINLGMRFRKKALLQGLLAILPARILLLFFPGLFKCLKRIFCHIDYKNSKIFFFEYLDNSIGYILKKAGIIDHYINDIHGVSTIEFDYLRKNTRPGIHQVVFQIKYLLSEKLDRKVFENAAGIVYSSIAMKRYFEDKYDMGRVKPYVLPNLISQHSTRFNVDIALQARLKWDFRIGDKDFVLFFAGGYKPTSGVDDLVNVFGRLSKKYDNLRLILVGDGPLKKSVSDLIYAKQIQSKVSMVDSVPYPKLITYQSLASVIVCPDQYNDFSDLIIHLKYLDSLISGRLVVNSSFRSMDEINTGDRLSVSFVPSDTTSLYQQLEKCILHYDELTDRYKRTREFALDNLTYTSQIAILKE